MESREAGRGVIRVDVFVFDVESRVLYRKGADTGLEAQPAHLLGLLLAHPNQIVSRQEILSAIWPLDSSGNFDDRINHAIRCIREALHDRQDDPRYIETVHKRGYKFIGQIQPENMSERVPGGGGDLNRMPLRAQQGMAPAPKSLAGALHRRKALITLSIFAVALLFVVASYLVARFPSPVIEYVSPILPRPNQKILILGRHLGKHVSFVNLDSPYLVIRDDTSHWAAGRITPRNYDDVTLTVASWSDREIVVTALGGAYGIRGWKLNSGDAVEVAVWNPETRAGPARFHLQVTDLHASR
jgi:DNA-binding winged helix-turn-helix (wHTH) protein